VNSGLTLDLAYEAVVSGGTVAGSVDNAGDLSLLGTWTITGDYTQESSATLDLQINSASSVDQLLIGGAANLAGTLNVTLASGYTPSSGDVFEPLESVVAPGHDAHSVRESGW